MIVLVVVVLGVWIAATTVLVGRRNPVPFVAPQAPIGPMTPTFRAATPSATVIALPVPRTVTTSAA